MTFHMRKLSSLFAMLMLLSAFAYGQTRTITGQVKDGRGNTVPFANILVNGTTTGVSSDVNGNFSIDVSNDAVLVISSTSFATREVPVGTSSTLSVTLTEEGGLQEVVVTALGVTRTRNQVPYAAQKITGEEVSQTRTSNFIQNLSGKVSGLELRQSNTLGGSTNVVIR